VTPGPVEMRHVTRKLCFGKFDLPFAHKLVQRLFRDPVKKFVLKSYFELAAIINLSRS